MAQNFADKRKMVERVLTNPDAIKRFRQADEGEEQVRGSHTHLPSLVILFLSLATTGLIHVSNLIHLFSWAGNESKGDATRGPI
jgi:hypothetical protein